MFKIGEMISLGCGSINDIKALPVYEKDMFWSILMDIEIAKQEAQNSNSNNNVPDLQSADNIKF